MPRSESQIVGRTHHMLVSLWGNRWREVQLVMFTLFIDDSGTSPTNSVAIATALIVPAAQIVRFETEWNRFKEKEQFKCFHTSIFVARNKNSEFAGWTDEKQERVFRRVRQISMKYGVRAVSMAVNKQDYDEVASPEVRRLIGEYHYTWAVRQLLAFMEKQEVLVSNVPREFVFQWMERHEPARKEIEQVMDQMQFMADREGLPRNYQDPHFRKSDDIPPLQCVDAIAWVSYKYAQRVFKKDRGPFKRFIAESLKEFGAYRGDNGWLVAKTLTKDELEKGITKMLANPRAMEFFQEWKAARINKMAPIISRP